jgi:hypothetical protein
VLVDGFFGGTWRITRRQGYATLLVEPFALLPARDRDAVVEVGMQLLAFAAADAPTHAIQVMPPR